jgi:hypothetical protein
VDSYSRAKKLLREEDTQIHMQETASVTQVDKDIDEVKAQLRKMRVPALELTPPDPNAKGKGKGRGSF